MWPVKFPFTPQRSGFSEVHPGRDSARAAASPVPPPLPSSVLPAAPPALRCCFPTDCAPGPLIGSDSGRHRQIREREEERWGDIFPSPSLLQSLPGPYLPGCQSHHVPIFSFSPGGSNSFLLLSSVGTSMPRVHSLSIPCPYICTLSLKAFSFKPGVSSFGP